MNHPTDDPLREALTRDLNALRAAASRGPVSSREIFQMTDPMMDRLSRATLAAAPQPVPAPADERAAMIEVMRKAFLDFGASGGRLRSGAIEFAADALLADGWTRGGDAAPHVIETQETEHDGENVLTPATQRRARQMSIFPDSSRTSAPETPDGG